ncbi:putative WD domain, G-beta repeat [Lyophyllum shimeji]|uniref:WD domain, G-beta repeat n=1 Tax=Lyophyllum shimeji TaxID=47721 RepID=A0A9P3PI47_LYOSH|nr:putative WD domain, G-beta repeat [Lyophyllum shimeji]
MADEDMLAMMGISGFGKAAKKKELDPARFDKNKRTPETASKPSDPVQNTPRPSEDSLSEVIAETVAATASTSSTATPTASAPAPEDQPQEPEYDPSDHEEYSEDLPQFPITHEITLKDHTKVVSALALDPSGARIVSGSHDYDSFQELGTSWDILYPRLEILQRRTKIPRDPWTHAGQIVRPRWGRTGDPYIRDMKHTSGHVGELTSCAWHPHDPKLFITSSADSTIRIWDVENKRKQKTVIVVKSKERGARTKITACGYSTDGKLIGGACLDGALHMWQTSSNFVRPNMTIEGAHGKGTETGSMVFSVDGRTVLTRGGDDSVKLWDLRAFKKPLATRSGLTTLYPNTNAMFSPDEKYIITGCGATSKGGKGKLTFLERNSLETVKELEMDSTPVKVLWHSKINQIVTGLSNGQIRVLYSPMTSLNGAKLLFNKGPPRKVTIEDVSDALAAPAILTPHALPMFRDMDPGRGTKRKAEKDRMDPRKSRRPELPVTGPGRGGRVGASATQHVVQHLVRDTTRDEDPREALLKYADKANSDPLWTAAWKVNQPNPVFAQEPEEEEEAK